ncbi:hypothetical protein K2173_023767 [Erythroxylum novogranatense]|uniref:40S ribosomal protein S8 n=1 Tax=Erythroxylum novogranatense TaxID=1862640 RepID=A0AAV8TJR2_9ROSI|nr:hypothetical protein K2173_023767 [Erythroxylum novogranatense]
MNWCVFKTFVKSAIIQVDTAPFKQWYLQHCGVDIGGKKKTAAATKKEGEVWNGRSKRVCICNKNEESKMIDKLNLLSFCIPDIMADRKVKLQLKRYILEGKELEFYMKKIQRKKGKGAA